MKKRIVNSMSVVALTASILTIGCATHQTVSETSSDMTQKYVGALERIETLRGEVEKKDAAIARYAKSFQELTSQFKRQDAQFKQQGADYKALGEDYKKMDADYKALCENYKKMDADCKAQNKRWCDMEKRWNDMEKRWTEHKGRFDKLKSDYDALLLKYQTHTNECKRVMKEP